MAEQAKHTVSNCKISHEGGRYVIQYDGEVGKRAVAVTAGSHADDRDAALVLASSFELLAALKYGLDLYGYDGPDGPWPLERRHEFDRVASAAIAKAEGR